MKILPKRAEWLMIAAVCILLLGFSGRAARAEIVDSGKCGANTAFTLDNEGMLTISGEGRMGYPHTTGASGYPWYPYRTSVKRIRIENGVTYIGGYAFDQFTRLTQVTIPDSVTSIGISAFYGCRQLTDINLPANLTSIAEKTFYNCESLTEIHLPESVTAIEASAFYGCSNLKTVTFPEGHTTIGESAFSGCQALESVQLHCSLGKYAFLNCTGLKEVSLQSRSIGEGAFNNCSALESIVLPEDSSLGKNAFVLCSSLKCVVLPVNLTQPLSYYFKGCPLETVFFPGAMSSFKPADLDEYGAELHHYRVYWAEEEGVTSYQKAEEFCQKKGGYLATVTAEAENTLLHDVLLPLFDCESAYFGLKRKADGDDRWKWSNGERLQYTNWANGEANNEGNGECYGMFYYLYPDGTWNDGNFSVDSRTAFICEWPDTVFTPARDAWSFANSPDAYHKTENTAIGKDFYENGYYISNWDFFRLFSHINKPALRDLLLKTDIKKNAAGNIIRYKFALNRDGALNPKQYTGWGGSCYGMSLWAIFNWNKWLSPDTMGEAAEDLGQIVYSPTVESAINFYQSQSRLPKVLEARNQFALDSQWGQIPILRKLGQKEKPFLIVFGWYDEFNADGTCNTSSANVHAVVGYGWERGEYTMEVNGTLYDFDERIKIYDPAYPDKGEDAYLYMREGFGVYGTSRVAFPAHNMISTRSNNVTDKTNNGALDFATDDLPLLNGIDFVTGEYQNAEIVLLDSPGDGTHFTVQYGGNACSVSGFTVENLSGNTSNICMALDAGVMADGETGEALRGNILLPQKDLAYTVGAPEGGAFSLYNGNFLLHSSAVEPYTVTFLPEGGVALQAGEGACDYSLALTADDSPLLCPTIQISGENAAEVQAEMTEDGVLLSADNLENLTINGSEPLDMDMENLLELELDTVPTKVLITNNAAETALVVMVDLDGDGIFETPLNEDLLLPGDVTGDGEVDAADVKALSRHLAKIEPIALRFLQQNADVTRDNEISADDLTKLARYVAKLISEL